MASQTGGCLCGAVRYEITAAARFAIQCYCRDCQRTSGASNLPQHAVALDRFSATGPLKLHTWVSDAGNDLNLAFCSDCGSPIYKTSSQAAALVFVAAGSLDDPSAFGPPKKIYEACRPAWDAG